MKLVPIGLSSKQDKVAKALALLLVKSGVEDQLALPLAGQIMGAMQAAVDDELALAVVRLEDKK